MSEVQKKAAAFVAALVKKYEENPSSIPEPQRKIVALYSKEKDTATKMIKDLQQLEQQIEQARKQSQNLQSQLMSVQGRASAFLEMLLPDELSTAVKASQAPVAAPAPANKPQAQTKKKTSKKKASSRRAA